MSTTPGGHRTQVTITTPKGAVGPLALLQRIDRHRYRVYHALVPELSGIIDFKDYSLRNMPISVIRSQPSTGPENSQISYPSQQPVTASVPTSTTDFTILATKIVRPSTITTPIPAKVTRPNPNSSPELNQSDFYDALDRVAL